jgi:hypothetical protein
MGREKHWLLYNLPRTCSGLDETVVRLPEGTLQGRNDRQRTGYGGPRPPVGRHRYFFKLYALDTALRDLAAPTKAALERAMQGHVIAWTELIGVLRDQPSSAGNPQSQRLLQARSAFREGATWRGRLSSATIAAASLHQAMVLRSPSTPRRRPRYKPRLRALRRSGSG